MRFSDPKERDGERRVVRRFALIPTMLGNYETKEWGPRVWLEWMYIEQVWMYDMPHILEERLPGWKWRDMRRWTDNQFAYEGNSPMKSSLQEKVKQTVRESLRETDKTQMRYRTVHTGQCAYCGSGKKHKGHCSSCGAPWKEEVYQERVE